MGLAIMEIADPKSDFDNWEPPTCYFDYSTWPAPIAEGASLESLIIKRQKYTATWKASTDSSTCHNLLNETVFKQDKLKITQSICLSLGSLSGKRQVFEGVKDYGRSMSLLVAFESWVEQLSQRPFNLDYVVH